LMLGGVLAISDILLSGLFSRGVVNALLIVLLVAVTRGLHQDGLADSLDGLAGGHTPEERLEIMRDGRIGAIGATGLALALGLRYAGFSAMPEVERVPGRFIGGITGDTLGATNEIAEVIFLLASPVLLSWR